MHHVIKRLQTRKVQVEIDTAKVVEQSVSQEVSPLNSPSVALIMRPELRIILLHECRR